MYLRSLSKQYGLPDPLDLIKTEPMAKETFKNMVMSRITAYHEKSLREKASINSKMTFMNVAVTGLTGRSHPILSGIVTVDEVKAAKPVIKCLTGDYYTYEIKASQTGGSSHCRICPVIDEVKQETEDIVHVVAGCIATDSIRKNMIQNVVDAAHLTEFPLDIDAILQDKKILCQFLLDNTSINLTNNTRVNIKDPASAEIFKQSRRLIAAIHAERLRKIKNLDKNN